jgi:hypothetical protein
VLLCLGLHEPTAEVLRALLPALVALAAQTLA